MMEEQSGNAARERFDNESCRSPGHVAGENVREHRADAGSERSGKRTKHDAAQQNEAVSRMNVAEGRCRDLDDHGRHACHGGEEGSSYQFFDILICHRKSPFLSDSYKSLYFNVDA